MKAFDRLSWSFMFECLKKFGFQENFVRWVRLCYENIFSAVKINGNLSSFFQLGRGCRQGCPLSPLLYILTAEVMAETIRKEPQIKGIPLPMNSSVTLACYADDTTLMLSDVNSVDCVFSVLRLYESASGAKINKDKCEGLWFGRYRGRTDTPYDLKWTSNYVNFLGFFIGNGDTDLLVTQGHQV